MMSDGWSSRIASVASLNWPEKLALYQRVETDLRTGTLTADAVEALKGTWEFWARPSQLEPAGDWLWWVILAGRGFGKTRAGAEWVLKRVREGARAVGLVGPTAGDVRQIMVTTLLDCAAEAERPLYEPSKRELTFPNGAKAFTRSADRPDQSRGPNYDTLWCDEFASWPNLDDVWKLGIVPSLRIGRPRALITTTPQSKPLLRQLLDRPTSVVTRGSTFENAANLAAEMLAEFQALYEGTRAGRQELYGELLEDVPGALWTLDLIAEHRRPVPEGRDLTTVVVGVDPSGAASPDDGHAEIGIVVAGFCAFDQRGYVLADYSVRGGPRVWASRVVEAWETHQADAIVAEDNFGGAMVEDVIRTESRGVHVKRITASRGKAVRAQPVANLYEQGRVSHTGVFPKLEEQMTTWDPEDMKAKSPDRLDALVWALSELMVKRRGGTQYQATPGWAPPVIRRGDLVLVGERYIDR